MKRNPSSRPPRPPAGFKWGGMFASANASIRLAQCQEQQAICRGERPSPTGRTRGGVSTFDTMAADYDRQFTHSLIGRLMREAVWRRMDARFREGDCVLEMNCGTGEDALHLASRGVRVLATDVSAAMVEQTRAKAAASAFGGLIEARQTAWEDLADLAGVSARFDGALSNFGGLNCVADLHGAAEGLARFIKPGGTVFLCIMGPRCPWEWAWHLGHAQPRKAFRRLRRGGIAWRGITVRYPSATRTLRAFSPWFRPRRVTAVGALVPPSYAEPWAQRYPRLVAFLNRCERCCEAVPFVAALADHYLLEMERVS